MGWAAHRINFGFLCNLLPDRGPSHDVAKFSKHRISFDPQGFRIYAWVGVPLDHDLYEVETLPENDRVRYTISPSARKEVLRRLLALNHTRAEAQKAAAKPTKPKRGTDHVEMFAEEP